MANQHLTHGAVMSAPASSAADVNPPDGKKRKMGKLTAKQRKKIPDKEFGEPSDRKYPMPDRRHAMNAKARATQQMEAGNLSKEEHAEIVKKADRLIYG